MTPIEPPPNVWGFPDDITPDEHGLVGVGADLAAGTLLAAYRRGLFPMPADHPSRVAWFSPDPRGVLDLDRLVVSRSLRRSCRRYEVTINRDFARVIATCAAIPRIGGWISPDVVDAYQQLHELGWAHSVETWADGELVGGLYGVQINALFAGESMFHKAVDASKVALVGLVAALRSVNAALLDVQWKTDHLATLGVHEISQTEYLRRLTPAIAQKTPSLSKFASEEITGLLPPSAY